MKATPRSEIRSDDRWNAESVFASPDDFRAAAQELIDLLQQARTFAGSLTSTSEALKRWFDYRDAVSLKAGKLRVYATMAYSTDTQDKVAAELYAQYLSLAGKLAEALAFAEPELIAAGFERLRRLIDTPELRHYGYYLDRLERQAAHTRSAEVETLLGALADPFATSVSTHGILANTDFVFEPARDSQGESHDITQGTINQLLGSRDRTLRKSAYESYADKHLAFRNSMAAMLAAGIKQNVFLARARRYASALEASLKPLGLPLAVFYNLIATFKANLPVWHRYWRAKRRMLGLDDFHPYDIKAQLAASHPVIPFVQSVDYLTEALAPLGEDYVTRMRRGALEERWVDKYPNIGKRMGAFSTGSPATYPFIMMSYSDDVFGMSTLAHELGHSLHTLFSNEAQPPVYARYSLFAAEVASNFNQAMLRHYLFEQTAGDDNFQLALIEEAMANFYRYFFIMPTLARFELELHERIERSEALSSDSLIDLMADLFAEGYGAEVVMDRERVGITWAQFHTHLYSKFYVYQYATGISGAHALANGILAGQSGAAERYLDFLKAGGSKDPLDALREAGVDLAEPTAVEETFGVLEGLVARLEGLIN
jgi:oligoendopeptidase F